MKKILLKYTVMLTILFLFCLIPLLSHAGAKVTLGIDVLLSERLDLIDGKRVGLITNQSGVNGQLISTIDLLNHLDNIELAALFGPEHGIRGEIYAGDKVRDFVDEKTGITVYSLYGERRAPTPEILENIDILLFDIQDIGSRTYTYVWTMTESMIAAKNAGIPFIVLDRPNPINGLIVEGNLVEKEFESFIGKYPVAYCHGMTAGELATLANKEFGINCDLTVISMKGWHRWMTWKETGLHWVLTSPHIPEQDTPWYYPTTGIMGELKVINEGVGYTLPFKIIGSPLIDGEILAKELNKLNLPGVLFYPIFYKPFYGPAKDQYCQGIKIIITDFNQYQPVNTGYYIMSEIQRLFPQAYDWDGKAKPRWRAFDRANGTDKIRIALMNNQSAQSIIASWQDELNEFKEMRQKYLIYE